MKKLLGISLTIVILSALFIGCGGGSASTTTQSQNTTSASATTSTPATSSKPATTSASPTTSITGTPPSTTPATSSTTTTNTTKPATTSATPTTSASGNDLSTLLGKAAAYANFYVEIKITAPDGVQTMKEWVKAGNPSKYRMEVTASGTTSVIIFDGTFNYFYDAASNTAIKMAASQVPSSSNSTSITTYAPVYVGSETVNGVDCSVYTYTASGVATKMWISKANGMTIRVVSGTTTMDYTNYSFASIPDSTFALPAGAMVVG